MRYTGKLTIVFLMVLYIGPMIFVSSYGHTTIPAEPNMVKDFSPSAGEGWYNVTWNYRKSISINASSGDTPSAGTNYQINITVPYNAHMQTDFDDIRFTDDDGITLLDYWREEYTASTSARFWVEVQDDLDSEQTIYMYYGNGAVSTTSNGTATFQAFYDKTSTAGWSTEGGLTVTTSGEYLRFLNAVPANVGFATRTDITTSANFQFMARYKTVSLDANDQGTTILMDASMSHRFSQSMAPHQSFQNQWKYYDGVTQDGGAWVEGTEFIFTMQVEEGESVTGIDYRRYDTSWSLLDSVLNENFALGSPTDCDGLNIGDGSGAGTIDAMYAWIAFRKCVDGPPILDSFGDEETRQRWLMVGSATLFFSVPFEMWGFDTGLIILGLVMIPTSGLYLAHGIKNDRSSERLFYALIIFFVGWGLFVGGILP